MVSSLGGDQVLRPYRDFAGRVRRQSCVECLANPLTLSFDFQKLSMKHDFDDSCTRHPFETSQGIGPRPDGPYIHL